MQGNPSTGYGTQVTVIASKPIVIIFFTQFDSIFVKESYFADVTCDSNCV